VPHSFAPQLLLLKRAKFWCVANEAEGQVPDRMKGAVTCIPAPQPPLSPYRPIALPVLGSKLKIRRSSAWRQMIALLMICHRCSLRFHEQPWMDRLASPPPIWRWHPSGVSTVQKRSCVLFSERSRYSKGQSARNTDLDAYMVFASERRETMK